MNSPSLRDVAHDLRNLIGLVRALVVETASDLRAMGGHGAIASADLDRYSRLALDALRALERWESDEPVEVSLGAWGWALRLVRRDVRVGDVSGTPRGRLAIRPAVAAGEALLDAIGQGRVLSIEPADDALLFECAAGAASPERVRAAITMLQAAGLAAEETSQVPCRVRVRLATQGA